jgi:replicative DNA helicase
MNRDSKISQISGLGKIPPQALDLEQAVLGAMLIEKDALITVSGILKPENFYHEKHEKIYKSIFDLFSKSTPVDILTVTQDLRSKGELEFVGGAFYITELTTRVNSAANIETHSRIIAEQALKREMIKIASQLEMRCYDDTEDAFEIMDELQTSIAKIESGLDTEGISSMKEVLTTVMTEISHAMNVKDGINGIPSGFPSIDMVTGGWQKGDLIIIAARPAMGKTAMAVCCALNSAIRFGKPGAIFSLEMSKEQLVLRMISSELDHLELSTDKLRRGKIDDFQLTEINKGINSLIGSKIFIDSTSALSITRLRSKAFYLKRKYNIEWIIVDYLQLMTANVGKGNREQEISTISRGLKNLAKDLEIPVIALAQLSRAVEQRGGEKRPTLSDLRESGAIEQDADIVSFLYRPEYYGIPEDNLGNSTKGVGEFIIAKHRNGSLEDIQLLFKAARTKFYDRNENIEPSSISDYSGYRNTSGEKDEDVPY